MKDSTLVERGFKLRFALLLCAFTCIGAAALTYFLYRATSRGLGGTYGEAIFVIHNLKIRLFPLLFSSFYSLFILALITLSIAVISLFFSHKIAGPIFRLERSIELIGSGDLTVNTRFRANDQLEALEEEINGMVRSLNHRVRDCADAVAEIKKSHERLALALGDGSSDEFEIKEALVALKRSVAEFKNITSGIKVKEDR